MPIDIHGDTTTHYENGELVIADQENPDAWLKAENPAEAEQ